MQNQKQRDKKKPRKAGLFLYRKSLAKLMTGNLNRRTR